METALRLFEVHGVPAIFAIVFAKRMGVPVPALPFLLLAGAQGVDDGVFALKVLAAAAGACVLADSAWFLAGRRYGRSMLNLLCRISMSPGSCIRTSELAFSRAGAVAVLSAKFIPGVAGMAPPLAGAMGMRLASFSLLNFAGTVLWAGTGIAAGLLLHRQVSGVIRTLDEMGSAAVPVLLLAFVAYLGWLAVRRLMVALAVASAPKLQPRELAAMLARGEPVVVVDVRGGGVSPGGRIPGAVHAPPDSEQFLALFELPATTDLVTYCDCPSDVSAARAALTLRKRGLSAWLLAGGMPAWRAADLPVEEAEALGASTAGSAVQDARAA